MNGIIITRAQLETWAGRKLGNDELDRLDQAIPNSSIPDAVETIVSSFTVDAVAPHGCGICDAPLRFVETDELGHRWYTCECGNGHTSQGCCCTVHVMDANGCIVDAYAPQPDGTHRHEYQGQALMHDHPGGDKPHGYYQHPEDSFPQRAPAATDGVHTFPRFDHDEAIRQLREVETGDRPSGSVIVQVIGPDSLLSTTVHVTDRPSFRYAVTVAADTREQADVAIGARLGHEEELGFDYSIDYMPQEDGGSYARQSVTWGEPDADTPTFTIPPLDPATMHVAVYDAALPPAKFPTGCPNCGQRLYSVEDVEVLYPVTIDDDGHTYDGADSVTGDEGSGYRDELCCRSCMWHGDRDDVLAMRGAAS